MRTTAPPGGIQLVEAVVAAMSAGDPGALTDVLTDDFVDHDPMPNRAFGPSGRAELQAGIEALGSLGADARFDLLDGFASADRVAYRLFGSWTVAPELIVRSSLAFRPLVTLEGVGIFLVRGGRLAERWGSWSLRVDGEPVSLTSEPGGRR